MSEPIPESIPTSADPRSKRPTKKRALTPRTAHSAEIEALFAKPDREIQIPGSVPKKTLAPPPEIVANVQGSSAGAGSGEFHVYKASRRREYERLRLMDEEVEREKEEREFLERKAELEKKDREKTEKNKAKREKARQRKAKKKNGNKEQDEQNGKEGTPVPEGGQVKKLGPNPAAAKAKKDEENEVLNGGGEVKNADEIGLVIHDDD
ncbi:DUF1168-domain-containing protein [Zopfia rhizophila CBS 207.26]|uniref:DUF1168-domain-containing protein n=1 Tax=Zopfia rhizophila CBS 207.26 TaxID=1314779 RepID=A0A6A6D9K0_9PEZI|nr:DUF1168-domain-containing protein [Zopfia rhizophila CBS 207.26]